MTTAVIKIRTRSWTARRARLWWPELLSHLVELAARQLRIPIAAIVSIEAQLVRALSTRPAVVLLRVLHLVAW